MKASIELAEHKAAWEENYETALNTALEKVKAVHIKKAAYEDYKAAHKAALEKYYETVKQLT